MDTDVTSPQAFEDDGAENTGKAEVLIRVSKVKEYAKSLGCSVGSDALHQLTEHLKSVLTGASARAKANKRKTIKACDF